LRSRQIVVAMLIASVSFASLNTLAVEQGSEWIYYRPFNLVYADQGGKTIPEDDATIINALKSFPKKPTMITDVILNGDPDAHAQFITSLKEITPNLCFALGREEYVLPADEPKLISIATKYSMYTRCIRVDHFQWLVNRSGEHAVRNYLNELRNLGFHHIMSNPWQDPPSGNSWPYIEAAQIQVINTTTTWLAPTEQIRHILARWPNITVVVNYENPGQQRALAMLGAQGSIGAMTQAADLQNSSPDLYRWMPPWSHNYDPYQLGTLSWEANKLAEIDPATSMTLTTTGLGTEQLPQASAIGPTAVLIGLGAAVLTSVACVAVIASGRRRPEVYSYGGYYYCRKHKIPVLVLQKGLWCPVEKRYLRA